MGRLDEQQQPEKKRAGVLMAAGNKGLSVCTASSQTFKLNAGRFLEGRRDLQEEPVLGNFWLRTCKREEWVKWEDLE